MRRKRKVVYGLFNDDIGCVYCSLMLGILTNNELKII